MEAVVKHVWSPLIELFFVLGVDKQRLRAATGQYLALAIRIRDSHNLNECVDLLNDLYKLGKEIAFDQTKVQTKTKFWLRSDPQGWPVRLSMLGRLLRGNVWEKRAAITVLSFVRLLKVSPKIKLESIQSPFSGDPLAYSDFLIDFKKWLTKFRGIRLGSLRTIESPKTLHVSFKGGPNGTAILTALKDLAAIRNSPEAWKLLVRGVKLLKRRDLHRMVYDLKDRPLTLELAKKDHNLAKIVAIPDKAGKTRIVYEANWWFQDLLKPVHEDLMHLLTRFPSDATYAQLDLSNQVGVWTKEGKGVYSFDLSSATDRWPISHQKIVMERLYGEEIANWWAGVLSIPAVVRGEKEKISYAVGQPMGAYSSWASFAVSHHLLVLYCAYKVGKPNFTDYVILGDDVSICDRDVAKEYLDIITSVMGIEVSKSKTYSPDMGYPNSIAEFAKRLFYMGEEITPIPLELIRRVHQTPCEWYLIPTLLRFLKDRWSVPLSTEDGKRASPAVVSLFSHVPSMKIQRAWDYATSPWSESQFPTLIQLEYRGSVINPVLHSIDEQTLKVVSNHLIKLHLLELYDRLQEYIIKLPIGQVANLSLYPGIQLPVHPFNLAIKSAATRISKLSMLLANDKVTFSDFILISIDFEWILEMFKSKRSWKDFLDFKDKRRREHARHLYKILRTCIDLELVDKQLLYDKNTNYSIPYLKEDNLAKIKEEMASYDPESFHDYSGKTGRVTNVFIDEVVSKASGTNLSVEDLIKKKTPPIFEMMMAMNPNFWKAVRDVKDLPPKDEEKSE